MARYQATIETRQPAEKAFAYLSDFSTAQEWDPGVVTARRLGDEPIAEGKEFQLVAEFLGRETPLTYRIIEYDPPHAVSFLAENGTVISRDRITLETTDYGTRVTYAAHLQLKGALGVFDPLLQVAFNRTGDRALEGLRRVLGRATAEALNAAPEPKPAWAQGGLP